MGSANIYTEGGIVITIIRCIGSKGDIVVAGKSKSMTGVFLCGSIPITKVP